MRESDDEGMIVPDVADPPVMPFTSQIATWGPFWETSAVNCCDPPVTTVGLAGEIVILGGGSRLIVTMAKPVFVESACKNCSYGDHKRAGNPRRGRIRSCRCAGRRDRADRGAASGNSVHLPRNGGIRSVLHGHQELNAYASCYLRGGRGEGYAHAWSEVDVVINGSPSSSAAGAGELLGDDNQRQPLGH